MVHPQVVGVGDSLQIWKVAANVMNKQFPIADKVWSSELGGWVWDEQLLAIKLSLLQHATEDLVLGWII
jgi:hypothetical protein